MPHKTQTPKLVTFGKGGDQVYYSRSCHSSGYGSPERPHAADFGAGPFPPDGCPVIDKCPAVDAGKGTSLAIRGPMVDVDLEPGQVDRLQDLSGNLMVHAMASEPGNQYGRLALMQMAARQTRQEYGPLDHVDIATYVRLWRVAGARIGHYQFGRIVWEGE